MLTPYQFASNSPVSGIDQDGLEYYWTANGVYLGHLNNSQDVYTASEIKDGVALNSASLGVKYTQFITGAAAVYGESSHEDFEEANSIAAIYISGRNRTAYGLKHGGKTFRKTTDIARNKNGAMKQSLAATIAYYNGVDYSNGANAWDGVDQVKYEESDDNLHENGTELHMNTEGWIIPEDLFKAWKQAVGKKFKAPQKKYTPVDIKDKKGRLVLAKDRITLKGVAQYGKTMFWKRVYEKKPKTETNNQKTEVKKTNGNGNTDSN